MCCEEKSNFTNKALVIVSTIIDKEGFLKSDDYAAMKRRLRLFRMNRTIRRKDQKKEIVDDRINEEFLAIAFVALSVCRRINEIVDDIKSFLFRERDFRGERQKYMIQKWTLKKRKDGFFFVEKDFKTSNARQND